MVQSDTHDASKPAVRSRVRTPTSAASTLRHALAAIVATGVAAVVIGLLPRF